MTCITAPRMTMSDTFERVVTVEEVRAAEEIWLIKSVRGWMRAVLLR